MALALFLLCATMAQAEDRLLEMQAGEVKVLSVPGAARVAVGDGHVVHAIATEEEEVIVFARNEGSSAMQIWTRTGERHAYRIQVVPEEAQRARQELHSLLERIPKARITATGNKIVVEGDDLADEDRQRIAALASRYPQLVDLTGQVGWEPMVLLDVQVVELPRSQLRELGLRWSSPLAGGVRTGMAWDRGAAHLGASPGETPFSLSGTTSRAVGYLGMNALVSAHIHALAQVGSAVVLAQPQLLARSGATAEFLAGGEVPYTTSTDDGRGHTVFKPYGVSLRITPQVDRSRIVRSRIEVEVSAVDQGMSMAGGPALKTRRAMTEFNVRSGQTLVLAGFLSRETARQRDGLPGLSDLPLLGGLFGSRRRHDTETELAIFVTPVLIEDHDAAMQARVEAGRAVLDASFPHPTTLTHPVHGQPDHASALGGREIQAWDPWGGPGSQWVVDSGAASGTSHQPTE
nr:pilus assembly protein N-terminal domain-containing protein [Allopusillimonas soli]